MLEAVVHDLSQLTQNSVATTWDHRLGPHPFVGCSGVEVVTVHSPEEERAVLLSLARDADAALVIAPEMDGLLEQRCRLLVDQGLPLLNCSVEAIQLCANKLAVYELCRYAGIRTIETRVPDSNPPVLPCVVKLRDGAGSFQTRLVSQPSEWLAWRERHDLSRFVVQPYVEGDSYSVGAFFDHGRLGCLLPPAEQSISTDGTFQYLGGKIPAVGVDHSSLRKMVEKFLSHVPGLNGYVGFDFLKCHRTHELYLVEVNPRLCTSYVGYRALCLDDLGEWLLEPGRTAGPRFENQIRFRSDGSVVEGTL
ncbi:ATP-grasp domain-containing protein [Planctomicrobium sp. SH661]|uniref:ATP-grasp domain-containing protein n=1 Tax=Planctomicrobium sp. SH661 TaxID=3448124 RepID=UPI003F5C2E69